MSVEMKVEFAMKDNNYQYNAPGYTHILASPDEVTAWNGKGGSVQPTVAIGIIPGVTNYELTVTYEHTYEYVQFSYGSNGWVSNKEGTTMTSGFGTQDSGWSGGKRSITTFVNC